jgi:beta-glucosidase-like glycosyl hydrolase
MRLKQLPAFSRNRVMGCIQDNGLIYEYGREVARQCREVGVHVNFAPVADVDNNPLNPVINTRSFGGDPKNVADKVVAYSRGLEDGGVLSVSKHFPGHGSTATDSHYGKAISERTAEELREAEFIPFQAGIEAGAELVMISHMSLPQITGNEEPCDFSYDVVTGMLREELGFEGLIVTDSHEMGAISYYYECGDAALRAVQAGCDVILMPSNKTSAHQALLDAIENGTLSEERINESVLRILSLKYKYGIIAE